jgi:hypothetical protein
LLTVPGTAIEIVDVPCHECARFLLENKTYEDVVGNRAADDEHDD